MTGSFLIEVKNADIFYKFTIRRNITVIRGKGATGKSTLYNLVDTFNNTDRQGISVRVTRGASLETLSAQRFRDSVLENAGRGNRIFIIDEDAPFIHSNEFAAQVNNSGYYFIIITRDKLDQISCSIHEVYELVKYDERLVGLKQAYEGTHFGCLDTLDHFITEDSNSGKQFFSRVYTEAAVVSSHGRDGILKMLTSVKYTAVYIVDGAAFGFNMIDVYDYFSDTGNLLIAEESFEYIILKSGVIPVSKISCKDLDNPVVDSLQYSSWEQFYTGVLLQATRDDYRPYKKEHLPQSYSSYKNAQRILQVLGLPFPNQDAAILSTHVFK